MIPLSDYEIVLVDTNVVSYRFGKRQEFQRFAPYLQGKIPAVSFVTQGEVIEGMIQANWGERKRNALLAELRTYLLIPIDYALVYKWAEVVADCRAMGKEIANNDGWIAATSIRHSIPLLTNDMIFRNIPGLKVLFVDTDNP